MLPSESMTWTPTSDEAAEAAEALAMTSVVQPPSDSYASEMALAVDWARPCMFLLV